MVGLAATCQARQNNDRQVTTYDFVDFQQLQVSGIVEVHFTQDKHYSISVEESTNPDLMTMVKKKGETLCIWTEIKKKNIRLDKDDKPIVHITAPKLNELRQSGATKTTMSGKLETDALSIFASGACKCQFGSIYCTDMVISSYDESSIHERNYHVQISARVFTESMHQLNDTYRRCSRSIYPAIHFVSFVIRIKTNLMKHIHYLSFCQNLLNYNFMNFSASFTVLYR